MAKVELRPGIFWVGGVDWELRNFHGYSTNRGTTYNAYLIVDEKIVLVDTVKHNFFDEMVQRIKEIVDPARIDIIVSNHVEMDHSGSLPQLLKICPNAKIVTSVNGEKGLRRHYKEDWNFHIAGSGETMKIGKRSLVFVHTPMVHWPDSMVTYIPEEKLLLPNDAFGQHIASAERFDDQLEWGTLKEEAAKYYSNIVLPYGDQVKTALAALSKLDIRMIGPSHGIIWRSRIPEILAQYVKWAGHETEPKALIVYDTMWGSTEKIAHRLKDGLEDAGVPVRMMCLKSTHMSDVICEMLGSRIVLIGSPTINNGILPSVGAFLTYIKGLRPRNRLGFAFSSYGWGGQAVWEIENTIKAMGWELPEKNINLKYIPDGEELEAVRQTGKALGGHVIGKK